MKTRFRLLNTLFIIITSLATVGMPTLFGLFFDATDYNYLICMLVYITTVLVPTVLIWLITKLLLKKNTYPLLSFILSGFTAQYCVALATKDYYSNSVYLEVMGYVSWFLIIAGATIFLCWACEKN